MLTRDMLVAEITRALRAHVTGDTDDVLRRVEAGLGARAVPGVFPGRVVAKAVRAAYPDRVREILGAIESLLPAPASSPPRRVRRAARVTPPARPGRSFPSCSSMYGQDVPWSSD